MKSLCRQQKIFERKNRHRAEALVKKESLSFTVKFLKGAVSDSDEIPQESVNKIDHLGNLHGGF